MQNQMQSKHYLKRKWAQQIIYTLYCKNKKEKEIGNLNSTLPQVDFLFVYERRKDTFFSFVSQVRSTIMLPKVDNSIHKNSRYGKQDSAVFCVSSNV